MKAADPTMLIERINIERWNKLRQHQQTEDTKAAAIAYVEPAGETEQAHGSLETDEDESPHTKPPGMTSSDNIVGKVQRLGDMVDTDAVRNTLPRCFAC
jgi:hypothetical protein